MIILGIDTSTAVTAVGLYSTDYGIIGNSQIKRRGSHAESALPALDHVLKLSNHSLDDVDLIAVTLGPGSFTGLRIGLTMAKTLAQAREIPLIGVSVMEAAARQVKDKGKIIVPVLDARRNRVYTAAFTWEGEELKRLRKDEVLEIASLEQVHELEDVVICGPSMELIKAHYPQAKLAAKEFAAMDAIQVALVGHRDYGKGLFDDPLTLVPRYLSLSQAEREKRETKR